jgi:hypothetical protein
VIVVLADEPHADIAAWLDRSHWPEHVAAVLDYATLMVMSESDFPSIHIWDDVPITPRWGRAVPVMPVSGTAERFVEGCRLLDWLPWHVVRLRRLMDSRQMRVRWTLGLLHSLGHSLRSLERVFGIRRPEWDAFVHDVAQLRQMWFMSEPDRRNRCASLVDAAHRSAREALAVFCAEVGGTSAWYGPAPVRVGQLSVPGGDDLCFGGPSGLPALLHRHFAAYAREHGPISGALRGALSPAPDEADVALVSPELRQVLRQRMHVCDRWASFLRANGFAGGQFKFGWFYKAL